jgi:hypothetical protein
MAFRNGGAIIIGGCLLAGNCVRVKRNYPNNFILLPPVLTLVRILLCVGLVTF